MNELVMSMAKENHFLVMRMGSMMGFIWCM